MDRDKVGHFTENFLISASAIKISSPAWPGSKCEPNLLVPAHPVHSHTEHTRMYRSHWSMRQKLMERGKKLNGNNSQGRKAHCDYIFYCKRHRFVVVLFSLSPLPPLLSPE